MRKFDNICVVLCHAPPHPTIGKKSTSKKQPPGHCFPLENSPLLHYNIGVNLGVQMITDVKEFLLAFFKQRHFDDMSAPVRNRWEDLRRNGDFQGQMSKWNSELEGHNLPNLDPTSYKKLYRLLQAVLQSMDSDRDNLSTDAKKFLDDYYGPYLLFGQAPASSEAKSDIDKLYNVIKDPNNKSQVGTMLKTHGVLTDDFTIDDLISGIGSEKHNADPKFRNKLLGVINYINTYQGYEEYWPKDTQIDFEHVDKIEDWFSAQWTQQTSQDFASQYQAILSRLTRESSTRKDFVNHDSNATITKQLNKALEQTNYEDPNSKEFIKPKVPDEKNFFEKVKSWKEDTYENYLRKFVSSKGSRIYFSPFSQEIIKAIDKEKIKPTEGIDAIVNAQSKIMERISASNTAKEHFKYLCESLQEVKKLVPSAYAGAMGNGRKMRTVVREVIRKAVKDGKIDQAKTILEILSVCKYGYTDSKTMDAIDKIFKEDKDGFLSNKGLSWNKNEGVQFVTKAADKTLEYLIRGAGRGIVLLKNIYQKNRTKFRGDAGNLQNDINAANARRQQERAAANTLATNYQQQTQIQINDNNQHLSQLANRVQDPIPNEQAAQQLEQNKLPGLQQNLNQARTDTQARQTAFDTISVQTQDARNRLQAEAEYSQRYGALVQEINTINAEITKLQNEISALSNTPIDDARKQILTAQLTEQIKAHDEKNKELTDLDNTHNAYVGPNGQQAQDKQAENQYNTAQNALNAAQTIENTAQQEYDDLNNSIQSFRRYTTENENLNKAIQDSQDTMANWDANHVDHYLELMSYWDTLETISKTHSFELATKQVRARELARETRQIGGKNVTKTHAQWAAWQDFQNYQYS